MKPTFLTQIIPSFMLFVDHELLKVGGGFTNYSGQLYPTKDPYFKEYNVFGSPFRQWVADSSVGATVPSGVFSNGEYISKGTSGISLDFVNGRVIAPNYVELPNPTINYAFKDINVYYTDSSEEKLLFDTQFKLKPQNNYEAVKPLDFIDRPVPCLYVSLRNSTNDPFAFGGLDNTKTSLRTVIITNSNGLLDSVISIFNDTARKVFSVIPNKYLPFNLYGDIKSGVYNYQELNAQHLTGQNVTYIEKVQVSKFDDNINKQIGNDVFAGFVDFELSSLRTPRTY